ncbi:MAG: CoA-binding protein [Gemmatimonadetes bacterium]|nr:CoA-binding protein [Gemmatimonadota bacterium]NIQ54203.1 CoA-binding protein [Gemmatimonadota bacterium]NIU74403.1 CoA-binding protein [Gammaproteobacteria bacterium]NIX44389.1 CoA-binding protein [Gemmatimonadota bacterium]NIY08607.1 CoA-binding protein [Gemmatimonadota bacterium]
METIRAAAEDFLGRRRIAVAGVSRDPKQAANAIYRRLRDAGYEVYPVNPNAGEVEGDWCYPSVDALPEQPDGVLIATHPDAAPEVARQCVTAGVPRVWMHRSFGTGSVSPEATAICREAGVAVLDGGCPLMFLEPVDIGHRCFRWILGATGKLPDGGSYEPTPV